jgi:hypothetical protein
MSETDLEDPAEDSGDDYSQLQQRCIKQIVFSGASLLVMLLALIALMISIVAAHHRLEQQKMSTSTYQLDELEKSVSSLLDGIKSKHVDNKAYLKQYEVLPFTQHHDKFYLAVLNDEQQFTIMINSYQSYIYAIASRVRGSGEWYNFFSGQLDYYQQRSLNRLRYLQALAPSPEDSDDLP